MIRILILAFICIGLNFSYGQNNQGGQISPEVDRLCKEIGHSKKIIGLGESTHGTSEFTTLRSQMVQTLVTKYNFRFFILEAEFVPCQKINEYILSGEGDSKALLEDVLLWPWIHEDFLELIEWLRTYNLTHSTDPVYFYGMDSQFSKIYAKKDTILKEFPVLGLQIFKIVEGSDKPKSKIKKLRALSQNLKKQNPHLNLRLHYYIFCQINKIAHSKYRDLNARDKNMASLVALIVDDPLLENKAMIWAHNGHLWKKGPSIFDNTATGYHLKKAYGKDYAVVGLDFKQGSFIAVSYDKEELNKRKSFQLKPITKTISDDIDFGSKDLVLINCSELEKSYNINSIGAIYVNNPQKGDAYYSTIKKNKEFDYLLLVKESSPIKLLEKIKK